MANIFLLNYCNLQCPYCFANEYIEEKKHFITLEQLDRIFNFLKKSDFIDRIGLIGGEPTLHPQLNTILDKAIAFSKDNHARTKPCLFSNGILLYKYADYIGEISCLLNVNHPDVIGKQNWDNIQKSLRVASFNDSLKDIHFGINLYPGLPDTDYIFELAKRYGKTVIRYSYAAPANEFCGETKYIYYTNGKEMYLDFVRKAKENNIQLCIDCNHIPMCYFTLDERALIQSVHTERIKDYCQPALDITPDFKGTPCFGLYDLIDLAQFETLEDARRYFIFKSMYPKNLQNNAGKCEHCRKFENLSCQGGCLAFAGRSQNETD